ncbi:MAG: PRC-barrel domain-containing protein [Synechococcales bacterium]|nr:PRC-barrel domain-containing protein [Synechococcales bacterium]
MVEQFLQRSDILGTQIITRDTGKRLGVVSQLWVDIDRREVVALGLRESMLSGVLSNIQQTMLLSSVRQVGDVILVDDDTVLDQEVEVEAFSSLINCEVITETGELLGKVRGFKFNATDGRVTSLVIASLGIPQIPDQMISTYELSMDEVVSSGPDRLIVFEGAEEKLVQLTVGVLERLGIGAAPWERRREDDYYVMPTSPANQLGTGSTTLASEPIQATTAAANETWDEDNWNEPQPLQEPLPQRQAEPVYYETDNWGGEPAVQEAAYIEEATYEEVTPAPQPEPQYEGTQYEDYDVTGDAWADDDNPTPYRPQKLNIPEKKRVVEYEEEADY